jgi:hypothetical protein
MGGLSTQAMMYTALIDGFLEKSASKWKEMILGGGLSGATKDKLLKQYVNPERMIAGLNRGSENIIKSYGGSVERSSFLDRIKALGRGDIRDPILLVAPAATVGSKVYMPKGPFYHFTSPLRIKHRSGDAINNRYLDALTKRHEADEVVAGAKSISKQVWSPNKRVRHWSPEVVMRESENMAFAPGAVQKKFTKARKGTGEVQMFKDVGVEYGQKSLYGKQRREAVNKLRSL